MKEIKEYINELEKNIRLENATEHTHRPALKSLLESIDTDLMAINEPRRTKVGAPDYVVFRGNTIIGYIEAKDIGKSLDDVEETEQLKRYLGSLDNLILTDYLEFRWYVQGIHRMTVKIGKKERDNKIKVNKDNISSLKELLDAFLAYEAPVILNAEQLAAKMAAYSRLIRDVIIKIFDTESTNIGFLHQQLEGFREILLRDLTPSQFADMYAQTICYGLFASRFNSDTKEVFTRKNAGYNIPRTNPFLRKMFNHVAGPDLDDRIVWIVDDISKMFNSIDIKELLKNFGKSTGQSDPVLHFYETFLAAYDPNLRDIRGVYYTPEPVVTYIVKSIDIILKRDFKLTEGLADASTVPVTKLSRSKGEKRKTIDVHQVQIFDPATGTGTFLHGVIKHIYQSFKDNKGLWSGYVSQHLLPRLYGFEILMAPYAVAHMKLGMLLSELGYKFDTDERLRVFLTNALEEPHEITGLNLFTHWLAEESNSASEVKTHAPVMVIVGNPPYQMNSSNNGEWITKLLRGRDIYTEKSLEKTIKDPKKLLADYYKVDDKPLGESNPKSLQDDYVKFIRLSQWRIERTGYGILAFITSHTYLEGVTFKGMRQSLVKTFDDIYVIDLHGNSIKREVSPDGSKDENIFDIRQGVAIVIFVKKKRSTKIAKIYHKHLWGKRQDKYEWLNNNDISSTDWQTIRPISPNYLLSPRSNITETEYNTGWAINEIVPLHSHGVTTDRDHLVVNFKKEKLVTRIESFINPKNTDEEIREKYFGHVRGRNGRLPGDTGEWNLSLQRKAMYNDLNWRDCFEKYSYRPYDNRYVFYNANAIGRGRRNVMKHMLVDENQAIVIGRQGMVTGSTNWDVIFSSKNIVDKNLFRRGGSTVFPMFIYRDESLLHENNKTANLSSEFIKIIEKKLNLKFILENGDLSTTVSTDNVFQYIYALLHSTAYRERYADFIKADFPKVQITSNKHLFSEICKFGKCLLELHIENNPSKVLCTFPEEGNQLVETVKYTNSKVWINDKQYFDNVSLEVWDYTVGGYNVCNRWLKERVGYTLDYNELTTYMKIVSNISCTNDIMRSINDLIDKNGGFPLN